MMNIEKKRVFIHSLSLDLPTIKAATNACRLVRLDSISSISLLKNFLKKRKGKSDVKFYDLISHIILFGRNFDSACHDFTFNGASVRVCWLGKGIDPFLPILFQPKSSYSSSLEAYNIFKDRVLKHNLLKHIYSCINDEIVWKEQEKEVYLLIMLAILYDKSRELEEIFDTMFPHRTKLCQKQLCDKVFKYFKLKV